MCNIVIKQTLKKRHSSNQIKNGTEEKILSCKRLLSHRDDFVEESLDDH